ncbi:hypothetical protein AB1Y20_010767 [Prymnesium parvum]|uniref:Uncharacterized protein n=1 Tax=Prymnesium parvum TaxID=97485 RepID=A0AB34IPF8_PRYPA
MPKKAAALRTAVRVALRASRFAPTVYAPVASPAPAQTAPHAPAKPRVAARRGASTSTGASQPAKSGEARSCASVRAIANTKMIATSAARRAVSSSAGGRRSRIAAPRERGGAWGARAARRVGTGGGVV